MNLATSKVKRIEGVLSPVITPFKKDYSPDADRFVRHGRWLLNNGCAGLAIFGTNSEANSMSVAEKRKLLEALVQGGVSPSNLMPGTGHCAIVASIIECVAAGRLPPYVYHAPRVSQVPTGLPVIDRLLSNYPGIVAGVKD